MKANSQIFWCSWVGQSWPSRLSWIDQHMLFRWGDDLTMFPVMYWLLLWEQLVTQVDRGSVLSKHYFISAALCSDVQSMEFKEVNESEIAALDLKKSNSFKNFKSRRENRFYEINMYMGNTNSNRRVRVNAERSEGIDLWFWQGSKGIIWMNFYISVYE